jgi:hypothetical protein
MSMEAVLDEERKEVLALLEGMSNRAKAPSSLGARSPSPHNTTRSPVRSMLDIGSDAPDPPVVVITTQSSDVEPSAKKSPPHTAPVRSMLDIDSPPPPAVRSMLDVDSPSPGSGLKPVLSNPPSVESNFRAHATNQSVHSRSMSDASTKLADFGPRSSASLQGPYADYQFGGIITSNPGPHLPKRVSQGGKRSIIGSAMAEALRGSDMTSMLSADRGRHSINGQTIQIHNKSKSPHGRLGVRSRSPHAGLLSGRGLSPAGRAFLADMQNESYDQNAYRRLSDANLARSQGSLSELTRRRMNEDTAKSGRLTKDYLGPDGEYLPEDSSDDNGTSSEDEGERGRKAARTFDRSVGSLTGNNKDTASASPETQRKSLSLLAAAEAERT